MRRFGITLGAVALMGLCLCWGCSREEPQPARLPKTKKPGRAPKPRRAITPSEVAKPAAPSTASQPTTTQAAKVPATSTATAPSEPAGGPPRLGDSRSGAGSGGREGEPGRATPQGGAPKSSAARPTENRTNGWRKIQRPDRTFYCLNCGHTFMMSGDEGGKLVSEAFRKTPGHRAKIKCPKCGQEAATPAQKCPKCGGWITAPETFKMSRGPLMPDFYDECKKCGYSRYRENLVRQVKERMKRDPKYDLSRAPEIIQRAVRIAKERGEW